MANVRDELYFMTQEDAAEAVEDCNMTLRYLYDKLDMLQRRKKNLVERLDKEIKACQDDIYKEINTRKAIEDAHFTTEEYRDIQDLTFDDVT